MENLTDDQKIMLEAIRMLSNEQRLELRKKLLHDVTHFPRSLFYNYETQEWIDA